MIEQLIGKIEIALASDEVATIGAADATPILIAAYGARGFDHVTPVRRLQYAKADIAAALAKLRPAAAVAETPTTPEATAPAEPLVTNEEPSETPTKARVRRPRGVSTESL